MDSSDTQLRVLVVEDCADTAETLRFLLDLWDHNVRVARNGHSALVLAPLFEPDVVLLDIGLPGPDGFHVARKLKDATSSELPVLIATTGYDGAAIRRQAREVGFDHFLPKPVDLAHLRALLDGVRDVVQV